MLSYYSKISNIIFKNIYVFFKILIIKKQIYMVKLKINFILTLLTNSFYRI